MTRSDTGRFVGRFAAFGVLVVGLCGSAAIGATSIVNLSETGTSLSLRFTDARGAQTTLNFDRADAGSSWKGPAQVGGPVAGIIFGNTNPQYATSSRLRSLGISAHEAVRTFDSSITTRTYDDITIFQLYESGEMAVALWQGRSISEIWYIGTLVWEVLADPAGKVCEIMKNLCSRTRPAPATEPPSLCPQNIPNPLRSACLAAVNPDNPCGEAVLDSVCASMFTACNFCTTHSACCAAVPGLEDTLGEFCASWYNNPICNPPPPEIEVERDEAIVLLGVVSDRLQAIIDTRP